MRPSKQTDNSLSDLLKQNPHKHNIDLKNRAYLEPIVGAFSDFISCVNLQSFDHKTLAITWKLLIYQLLWASRTVVEFM